MQGLKWSFCSGCKTYPNRKDHEHINMWKKTCSQDHGIYNGHLELYHCLSQSCRIHFHGNYFVILRTTDPKHWFVILHYRNPVLSRLPSASFSFLAPVIEPLFYSCSSFMLIQGCAS